MDESGIILNELKRTEKDLESKLKFMVQNYILSHETVNCAVLLEAVRFSISMVEGCDLGCHLLNFVETIKRI